MSLFTGYDLHDLGKTGIPYSELYAKIFSDIWKALTKHFEKIKRRRQ